MPIAGCTSDFKPGEYYRGNHGYVAKTSELSLAYRHENEGFLLAVLHAEADFVDLTLFRTGTHELTVSWKEEWFNRCSRVDDHLLCTANPDGPVLIGTINNSEAITLFGSGDPPGSTNTKEFAYQLNYSEPDLFRESDWAALRSDFDAWLNQ